MSEMVKTLIYVGVALLLAVTAWVWQPRTAELKVNKMVGSKLFGNFKDADEATSLTITSYDDKFGKPVKFQIARDAGSQQWVIPSEDDYPVAVPDSAQPDNPIGPMGQPAGGDQTQMQKAATALIGLEILGVASEKRNDHELFGVVEPSSKAKAKPDEIGMLVEVTGDKQSKLADLVIGKAVADNSEQRFVRVRGQDVTYVVKIDVASFTTELSKWIEADLLALSPFDIRSVALKDYSILEVLDPRTNRPVKQLMQRSDTALSWNQEESKWSIRHMLEYKTATQPTPTELTENEELNSDRLNELKNALDDLKIVGVKQKPADSNQTKLMEYGYYPFSTTDENNKPVNDVRSANGEVHVSLQDGTQYVLRFGDIAPLGTVNSTAADSADEIYRYLVVMVQLDKSQIPPPEMTPEPPIPAPAEGKKEETPAKKDAPKDPQKKAEPEKKPSDQGACGADEEKQPAQDKSANKKAADKEKKPASDENKKAADEQAKPAADPQTPTDKTGDKPADKPPTLSADEIKKVREFVRKENERKMNAYQDKLAAAEKRIAKLNERFANWCFIIDEKVYHQVHLSQSDVITAKGESELDTFRNLDSKGLDAPEPKPGGENPALPELPQQP